jgi:hypothetical protein
MAAVSALPDGQQGEAALILLQFAGIEPSFELTAEDEAELDASLAEEERGEFATDAQVRAMSAKYGL